MILSKNGYIKPMVGADLPNGGVLLGDDGKIMQVAASIEAPANCTVIDAEGRGGRGYRSWHKYRPDC